MTRRLLLPLFLLIAAVTVIFSLKRQTVPSKGLPLLARERIEAVLPTGSFLRDYQRLAGLRPETFLILSVEKGYQKDRFDPTANSCPAMILGESVSGRYHLALFRGEKIVDDLSIPNAYNDEQNNQHIPLALSYRNSQANLEPEPTKECVYPNDQTTECLTMKEVKLLDLKDYTGEGQPLEFLLTTTAGGCGFYDRLAAGYDPQSGKLLIYSDWLERFNPNSQGESNYLLDCGDHGNNTRLERKYKFNPTEKKFKLIWERQTAC